MCEEAGAIKQVTRKGNHYIFLFSSATAACERAAASFSAATCDSDTRLGRRCARPPADCARCGEGGAASLPRAGLCRCAAEERRRCTGPEGTHTGGGD